MSFSRTLLADDPDPERKGKLGLYAWLMEVIMQMAVNAGFPAALNGLFAAKESI
jgi:hypothetical protein